MLRLALCVAIVASFHVGGCEASDDANPSSTSPAPGRVEYCVVGAGPGGVQVGAMLREAGREVVVLDRASRAGSFFERFPVHRRLISINKVHFMKAHASPEFRLRHDWNSLISLHGGTKEERLRFPNYTSAYYPHADTLVAYLGDFARATLAGRVSFDTHVTRIEKAPPDVYDADADAANDDTTTTFSVSTNKGVWTCTRVVVATGLTKPSPMPALLNHPDVIGYEQLPENGTDAFTAKRVAIFGCGNAGMEAAAAISKVAAHVDVWCREVRLAWQNHYPGAVRTPNAGVIDQFQLKSLDSLIVGINDIPKHAIVRVGDELQVHDPLRQRGANAPARSHQADKYAAVYEKYRAQHPECRGYDGCYGYDAVVRALGWVFDTEVFAGSARPLLVGEGEAPAAKKKKRAPRGKMVQGRMVYSGEDEGQNEDTGGAKRIVGKYPAMTSHYESTNVPGLFFAGSEVATVGVIGAMMGGVLAAGAAEPRAMWKLLGEVR